MEVPARSMVESVSWRGRLYGWLEHFILRVVKYLSVFLILIPPVSHAASEAALKDSLKAFYTASQKLRTAADYLDAFKDKIPPEVFDDLKKRAAGHEKEDLPTVEMRGDDTLVFSFKGQFVPFKIHLGDREAFEINHHVVDFTDCKSADERWAKVIRALPESAKKTSALDLLLPFAHADDDNGAERTNSIAFGAVGAAAIALGWNAVGWGIMAYGAWVWNNAVCNDMSKDVVGCGQLKDLLDEQMEKNPASREAIDLKKPRSACPKGEARLVDPEKTEKIQNYFKALIMAQRETSRLIAVCPSGPKGKFAKCLSESALSAHYLCINMYGFFDNFLPAWAKTPSTAPAAPANGAAK
jgi:hypothetical protein